MLKGVLVDITDEPRNGDCVSATSQAIPNSGYRCSRREVMELQVMSGPSNDEEPLRKPSGSYRPVLSWTVQSSGKALKVVLSRSLSFSVSF